MTVPFMRAYTNLLIKTCHRRGAHAMGGMAAFVPSRKDPEVNAVALEQVQRDKQRETGDGFDGTWVAHPDLVPVARLVFAVALNQQPHQKDRYREDVQTTAEMLLNITVPGGQITEKGLRNNISVTLQYLNSWLQGSGAVAIFNLMEDAATAEISRSQLWQWLHHPQAQLSDGRAIEPGLFMQLVDEELLVIRNTVGEDYFEKSRYSTAQELLNRLVMNSDFLEFLTLPASEFLNEAN
jgi:malate synthase